MQQALELRIAKATYAQIAQALGCTERTAHNYVTKALAELPKESAMQLRNQSLALLDKLHKRWYPIALKQDPDDKKNDKALTASMMLMRVEERRSKMLGLDEPEKLQVIREIEQAHEAELQLLENICATQDVIDEVIATKSLRPVLVAYCAAIAGEGGEGQARAAEGPAAGQPVH
jgi:predicted transcriptional regulator